MEDHVVLVDEKNAPLGTLPKLEAHSNKTPLHRGFSLFLFNAKGELLLQKRAKSKKTWPGVWSNSACGHPRLNEQTTDAAKRHLGYELGIKNAEINIILPDYRYRFEREGVVENEICPVMVATSKDEPIPNPNEVEEIMWTKWSDWLSEVNSNSEKYSEWCVEETLLLNKEPQFSHFFLNEIQAQH